jgi:hypothetical protein
MYKEIILTFIGVIPGGVHYSEWLKHLEEKRKTYQDLLEKYEVDPHKSELDPNLNNPLSEDDQVLFVDANVTQPESMETILPKC